MLPQQAAEAGLNSRRYLIPAGIIRGRNVCYSGALDDVEILRARQFVDSYYRTWGGRYVQFAIELKDDWLKGRSFQYGAEGYIKMSLCHWYFPSPL